MTEEYPESYESMLEEYLSVREKQLKNAVSLMYNDLIEEGWSSYEAGVIIQDSLAEKVPRSTVMMCLPRECAYYTFQQTFQLKQFDDGQRVERPPARPTCRTVAECEKRIAENKKKIRQYQDSIDRSIIERFHLRNEIREQAEVQEHQRYLIRMIEGEM